jgi:hypothetical protein
MKAIAKDWRGASRVKVASRLPEGLFLSQTAADAFADVSRLKKVLMVTVRLSLI